MPPPRAPFKACPVKSRRQGFFQCMLKCFLLERSHDLPPLMAASGSVRRGDKSASLRQSWGSSPHSRAIPAQDAWHGLLFSVLIRSFCANGLLGAKDPAVPHLCSCLADVLP